MTQKRGWCYSIARISVKNRGCVKSAGEARNAVDEHARRARATGMDVPRSIGGRDNQIPPRKQSEGRACHARSEGHARRAR